MAEQKHWITVHWPHPVGGELGWNVYLRREHFERGYGDGFEEGARVLFYQTAQARDRKRALREALRISSGEGVPLQLVPNGLIGEGIAMTGIDDRPTERIQFRYGQSDPYQWSKEAICKTTIYDVGVAHEEVRKVLGYRMFFESGLRKISSDEYERLVTMLRDANKAK